MAGEEAGIAVEEVRAGYRVLHDESIGDRRMPVEGLAQRQAEIGVMHVEAAGHVRPGGAAAVGLAHAERDHALCVGGPAVVAQHHRWGVVADLVDRAAGITEPRVAQQRVVEARPVLRDDEGVAHLCVFVARLRLDREDGVDA
jgi:hypothetical protein